MVCPTSAVRAKVTGKAFALGVLPVLKLNTLLIATSGSPHLATYVHESAMQPMRHTGDLLAPIVCNIKRKQSFA